MVWLKGVYVALWFRWPLVAALLLVTGAAARALPPPPADSIARTREAAAAFRPHTERSPAREAALAAEVAADCPFHTLAWRWSEIRPFYRVTFLLGAVSLASLASVAVVAAPRRRAERA